MKNLQARNDLVFDEDRSRLVLEAGDLELLEQDGSVYALSVVLAVKAPRIDLQDVVLGDREGPNSSHRRSGRQCHLVLEKRLGDCASRGQRRPGDFSVAYKADAVLVDLLLNLSEALELHHIVELEAPVLKIPYLVDLGLVAAKHLVDACLQVIELDLEVTPLLSQLLPAQLHVLLRRLDQLIASYELSHEVVPEQLEALC